MLQRVGLLILCLAFSLSSLADEKRAPASAAGKANAMKYILGRKPAQEQYFTSADKMRDELASLYTNLNQDIPNQAKADMISAEINVIGNSLGYILDHTSDKKPTDVTERARANHYRSTVIFLSQLTVAKNGQWDKITCTRVRSVAQMDDANNRSVELPPGSMPAPQASDDGLPPVAEVITKICTGQQI